MAHYLGPPSVPAGAPVAGPVMRFGTRQQAERALARAPRGWVIVEAASLADALARLQHWPEAPAAHP